MAKKLKVGDKVQITKDLNQLNQFMHQYAGQRAVVTSVEDGNSYGQIAKLDIDGGSWYWSYEDKLHQISKV